MDKLVQERPLSPSTTPCMDVLDTKTPYEKIYIVRSLVPTREIGFLPGDHEDKSDIYQIPYKNMVKYMFEMLR